MGLITSERVYGLKGLQVDWSSGSRFRAMRCLGCINWIQFAKDLKLASYCYHNFSSLSNTVIILRFCRSEIQWAQGVSLLEVHVAKVKALVHRTLGVESISGPLQVVAEWTSVWL